ncbi:GbsR/MarR family transcriptional regulator [Crossiella cryophila]|uniref:DNA-binding transcriptional regulator GbsR (MarR family) n=1 Tax=Crossiella cryophila TaxID=43355 RepID=A0A7W7C4X6_9PSEU|nr:MarR family transcriptional regulator [Crossiella cryophila]MBB4674620.1 DNA-binding transcriptional regulator GbsR (MarR family) [Crossiella cryophila]
MTGPTPPARDEAAVARFVERFALILTDAGWPRMPSRIFASLLASDDGTRTAADLATHLQISPAAVSGGVRYLTDIGLATKERSPGARRDHYRVRDDLWFETLMRREQQISRWVQSVKEGIQAVGPTTPAGHRLELTRDFFEFLQTELPTLVANWQRPSPP